MQSVDDEVSSSEKREAKLILRSKDHPFITQKSLAKDLRKIGVKTGMTLLVHSSPSSLGWVCGGAAAIALALEEVLGDEGTLVMLTHSGDLSDPAMWKHPPVPEGGGSRFGRRLLHTVVT